MFRPPVVRSYQDRIASLISAPGTSYWIKNAINDLMRRDPIDAARDASLLAALFEQRANEVTGIIL